MALPPVPKRKSKDKRKGRIIGGKQTDLKQNHPHAVPGRHELRQNLSQGQSRGSHGRMSQHVGTEQGFGRVGMGILAGWGMRSHGLEMANPTELLHLGQVL